MIVIKARAPSRIGIGGGGSDIPAFFEQYGGAVLNVAIDLYSYTKMIKTDNKNTKIISHDWGIERTITDTKLEPENTTTNVDMVKATMEAVGLSPTEGYSLLIHSMAPKNSGLAGSSALMVSLMAAISNAAGMPMMDRDAVARKAYDIERTVLSRPGGYQDQYAAVFGGFNFIEFKKNAIINYPLRLEEDLIADWHSSMLLFETPQMRQGDAHNIERQKIDDIRAGGDSIEHLKNIRNYAYCMLDALMHGDTAELGDLLHNSWLDKKKLPGVSLPYMDKLYQIARDNGAYGGKINGAGGGGFLFVVCDVSNRQKITNGLSREGAKLVNFNYDLEGMLSWRTDF
jgi:D-glycero-alpha-D-manno-heptose-7-phosphate kinase